MMAPTRQLVDHEALFRLIHDRNFRAAATILHANHRELDTDPLLQRAADAFVETIGHALESDYIAVDLELLEKLFLMHQGSFLILPSAHFQRVVELLVEGNESRPEAALAYAQYCPESPVCRAALEQLGAPVRRRVHHDREGSIEVVTTHSLAQEATRTLLRSSQEECLFQALREIYPTHLVYPNVALSAVLDFEVIESRLSRKERQFFFRGLIDCVVFDFQPGLKPLFFFELDSPLHDDSERQERDRLKDRILAAAGQHLFRIRSRAGTPRREDFVVVIRETLHSAAGAN